MRIFLDANILFLAGYSPASPVHDLLQFARLGDCQLVTSSYALEEAHRNLAVKGPSDWTQALARAREVIETVGEAQGPAIGLARAANLSDANDVPILAAAIQSQAAVLVTGDRRAFGKLFGTRVAEVEVLTLRDVLQRIVRDRN